MKWIQIRISKFTRTLHPDDYQQGLPQPGIDEGVDRYRTIIVGNQGGTWVGRDDVAEAWLQENRGYKEAKHIVYANDAKEEAQEEQRPIKKDRKKPLPKQKVASVQPTVQDGTDTTA